MEEKKHCKWYNNEFCTNGDSPCVADYCPIVEYPELCKFRELDNGENLANVLANEQKLTDKEIKQAFFILAHGSAEGLSEYVKAVLAIKNEYNRQKAEIERLTGKVENQKAVIKCQADRIEKGKAENQRLYDEFVRLDDFCATKGCICCVCENKKTCNECAKCGNLATGKCNGFKIDISKYARAIERADKLQKQVDELKKRLIDEFETFKVEAYGKVKHQAEKDTAKEIYELLEKWVRKLKDENGSLGNFRFAIETVMQEIKEKYSLEVSNFKLVEPKKGKKNEKV